MAEQDYWIALDDIERWGDNPNQGNIAGIKKSIQDHGYNDRVIVWQGELMGGNHTTQALRELLAEGWQPEDCPVESRALRLRKKKWEVFYMDVSHMEREQAVSFALRVNNLVREGKDDAAKLFSLMAEMSETARQTAGFSPDMFRKLTVEAEEAVEPYDPVKGMDITGLEVEPSTSYMIYLTAQDRDDYIALVNLLTYGERSVPDYASFIKIRSEDYIDRWENDVTQDAG